MDFLILDLALEIETVQNKELEIRRITSTIIKIFVERLFLNTQQSSFSYRMISSMVCTVLKVPLFF